MTGQFRLVTPGQANAIRLVALSWGVPNPDMLIEEHGLGAVVGTTPRRCRLRIGRQWPRTVPAPTGERGWPPATVYRARPPRCRCCGGHLADGPVITFGAFPDPRSSTRFMGVDSFLHADRCDGAA